MKKLKRNCHFKIGIRNFSKFWLENVKVSKIYTLMGPFWPKYIMFELKKYRGITFHDTRVWCKIWRKTDLLFGKWHEEFGTRKSQNWNFHWVLLCKVENIWAQNLQGSYVLRQWRMIQNLEKNWFASSKLTWGI